MAGPWHLGRLAPFDLETTSPDPRDARIVEAYVGLVGGGLEQVDREPLFINPGIAVPAEAVKIHGYTDEFLQEHGVPAEAGVWTAANAVADAVNEGVPLVGANISYDLTVLTCELARHGLPSLEEMTARSGGLTGKVIDTFVISKKLDRWRKRVSPEQGAHTLKTCAQVFGIPWVDGDAHGARYDALISARVAWRMGSIAAMPLNDRPRVQAGRKDERHLFDELAVDLPALFASQRKWAAEQAASYQEYLRSEKAGDKRNDNAVIDGSWPIQAAPVRQPEHADQEVSA